MENINKVAQREEAKKELVGKLELAISESVKWDWQKKFISDDKQDFNVASFEDATSKLDLMGKGLIDDQKKKTYEDMKKQINQYNSFVMSTFNIMKNLSGKAIKAIGLNDFNEAIDLLENVTSAEGLLSSPTKFKEPLVLCRNLQKEYGSKPVEEETESPELDFRDSDEESEEDLSKDLIFPDAKTTVNKSVQSE